MPIKPIAAGTPQRIIAKINEIINAVNTGGGSGGSGTADTILDAATIADAGKALGIDAEGEPALISVSGGGGASLLVCNLTYTGTGDASDPYVGHLDHAAEILDALDPEIDYSPIIFINYTLPDAETKQLTPAVVIHSTGEYSGTPFTQNMLKAYGPVSTANVTLAYTIGTAVMGSTVQQTVIDMISGISAEEWTVADDVLTYRNPDDQ